MAKVKTSILTGTEVCVENLGGQNVAVKNLGEGSVYASAYPNIIPGEDNVIEITAGSGEVVLDTHGTVYLLGVGKVQCTGTDYATINFGAAAASEGGSGGTGDVTKGYVDAQDTTNLASANAYTDKAVGAVKSDIAKNTDDIAELKADVSAATETADAAQTASNAAGTAAAAAQSTADTNKDKISALQEAVTTAQGEIAENIAAIADNSSNISALQASLAKAQADISAVQAEKANKTDIPTTLPANGGTADTVGGHTVNFDVPENAVFTDTTYSDMQGATESAAGAVGLVPAPAAVEEQRYLSAKGSFSNPMTPIGVTVIGLNLNDYKTSGMFYFIAGAKPDNRPAGSTSNGILIVIKANDSQIRQIWFDGTDKIYIRAYLGNEWTAWIKIVTETVAISAAYGENEDQAAEIMQQLSELDSRSIRPLRAIFAGTATDEDRDKLAEIEGQAGALRGELAVLGGD